MKAKKQDIEVEAAKLHYHDNCKCDYGGGSCEDCDCDDCDCSKGNCTDCGGCKCDDKHKKEHHHGKHDEKAHEGEPVNQDEYKDRYMRALADYQNLEKRIETMKTDIQRKTRNDIVGKFLNILDHLEKAEAFMQDPGLMMVAGELKGVIKQLGLEELDLEDKEYDPYTAEAIEVVEGDKDNIVTEVVKKGYKIGNDVIRPAHVKVSKVTKN